MSQKSRGSRSSKYWNCMAQYSWLGIRLCIHTRALGGWRGERKRRSRLGSRLLELFPPLKHREQLTWFENSVINWTTYYSRVKIAYVPDHAQIQCTGPW